MSAAAIARLCILQKDGNSAIIQYNKPRNYWAGTSSCPTRLKSV